MLERLWSLVEMMSELSQVCVEQCVSHLGELSKT